MGAPHPRRRTGRLHAAAVLAALLITALSVAAAQVSVPTFGTRGDVDSAVVDRFMVAFRSAVGAATGLEVRNGDLITPGIASSLEPDLATLIAELDSARYAVSGEIARLAAPALEPYAITLIVVDADFARATDLISASLDPAAPEVAAAQLAAMVAAFTTAKVELPRGDSGLFVSSEPGDAQVFVDGVSLGRTGQLDVAMLVPGRYQLEVRKEGFLPDARMIELRPNDTTLIHVILTAISGGSVQISSRPGAMVELDGVPSGRTPVTLTALPGMHTVTLKRDGFADETVDVLVRNYRVYRLQLDLQPIAPLVVFWDEAREMLVFIDGIFQPGGHAIDMTPGLHTFELRRGAETFRYLRAVPDRGVFKLDLSSGELSEFGAP